MIRINNLLIIFLLIISIRISAQTDIFKNKYLSPEITIGYTFNAKINIGLGVDFGFYDLHNVNIRYGGSLSYNLIKVKDRFHRQTSINLMVQNSFSDFKFGLGRMRNGWGYENRNKCIVWGFVSDLSINYPNYLSPKIGYRNFIYNKQKWAWFEYQYHSLYTGYEYYNK